MKKDSFLDRKENILVSGGQNLLFWEVRKQNTRIVKSIENVHKDNIFDIISVNKNLIASCSLDQKVRFFSLKDGSIQRTVKASENGNLMSLCHIPVIKFGNDRLSKIATSSHQNNEIFIWNLRGKLVNKLKVNKIVFYEKKNILSCSDDSNIILWDYKKNKLLKRFNSHKSGILCLDIYSDNHFFVSGGEDCSVKIWSIKEEKCVKTLEGHKYPVSSIVILPSLNIVSGDTNGEIRIWDFKLASCLVNFRAHRGYIWDIISLPDSQQVVSCSSDCRIKFYETDSGKIGNCRRTFETTNEVYSLLFLPKL